MPGTQGVVPLLTVGVWSCLSVDHALAPDSSCCGCLRFLPTSLCWCQARSCSVTYLKRKWGRSSTLFPQDSSPYSRSFGILPIYISTDFSILIKVRISLLSDSFCEANISLSDLPPSMTCIIPDSCTGVDCCVDVDILARSINTYVLLDACNYVMRVGIEKLNVNISLIDYSWGKLASVTVYIYFHLTWFSLVNSVNYIAFSCII
jgi:hypothetical protein